MRNKILFVFFLFLLWICLYLFLGVLRVVNNGFIFFCFLFFFGWKVWVGLVGLVMLFSCFLFFEILFVVGVWFIVDMERRGLFELICNRKLLVWRWFKFRGKVMYRLV